MSRSVTAHHFNISDACAAEGFFLHSVSCRSLLTKMVPGALEFDSVKRFASTVHDQQIDSLCIDCPISFLIFAPQYLSQRDLTHSPPTRRLFRQCFVNHPEQTALWFVQKRSWSERCSHDAPQLVCCVGLGVTRYYVQCGLWIARLIPAALITTTPIGLASFFFDAFDKALHQHSAGGANSKNYGEKPRLVDECVNLGRHLSINAYSMKLCKHPELYFNRDLSHFELHMMPTTLA